MARIPIRQDYGGNASMTPKELVDFGIAAGDSYLSIGKHYLARSNQLRNISPSASEKFKRASELAFHIHKELKML